MAMPTSERMSAVRRCAVAHEGNFLTFGCFVEITAQEIDLAFGQKTSVIFVETGFAGNMRGHFFTVSCEHDGVGNTQLFDALDGFDGVFFDGVFDFDRATIFAVDRNVQDGRLRLIHGCCDSVGFHQACIASEHDLPIDHASGRPDLQSRSFRLPGQDRVALRALFGWRAR